MAVTHLLVVSDNNFAVDRGGLVRSERDWMVGAGKEISTAWRLGNAVEKYLDRGAEPATSANSRPVCEEGLSRLVRCLPNDGIQRITI